MTTIDPHFEDAHAKEARKARLFSRINTADKWFSVIGLAWVTPILRAEFLVLVQLAGGCTVRFA